MRAVLTAIEREEAESRDEEAEAQRAEAAAAEPEELTISDEVLFGEPPDVVEADTEGLPPMRARLVRFFAWLAALRADRERKETGRHAFLRSMNAPVVTEAEITELVASDKMSWIRHILSLGSSPTRRPLHPRAATSANSCWHGCKASSTIATSRSAPMTKCAARSRTATPRFPCSKAACPTS